MLEESPHSVSLYRVDLLPVSELLRLRRDLDVFSYSAALNDALLTSRFHPPVVIGPAQDGTRVVWGWHIVRAAASLQLAEVPVASTVESPKEQLCTALDLEGRVGRYAFSEQEAILSFVEYAELSDSDGEIARRVVGDGSFVEVTRKYRALPPHVRELIDREVLDLKTCLRLSPETAECLWSFRHTLSEQTVSNRRIIAGLLDDILRRDQLDRESCEKLLGDALDSDHPRMILHAVRYPQLSELERRFDRLSDSLVGGTGVTLRHPPYFEGAAYTVEFAFRNRKELEQRGAVIKQLEPACDELFDLL